MTPMSPMLTAEQEVKWWILVHVCVGGEAGGGKGWLQICFLVQNIFKYRSEESVFLKHDTYMADKKRNSCIKQLQGSDLKKGKSPLLSLLFPAHRKKTVIWYTELLNGQINFFQFKLMYISGIFSRAYLKMYLSSLLLSCTLLNTINSCISRNSLSEANEGKIPKEKCGQNTAASWTVL